MYLVSVFCFTICILTTIPQSRGGYSEKFWWGCAARVFATKPLATETEGQNHTLAYGKWVKIKPLTIGNIIKLTTFEAVLQEIGQIWPKFCHLLWKNAGNRSKWPKFAEKYTLGYRASAKIRPLATEIQPKIDPWLQKWGSKRDPCEWHTTSKV